MNSVADIGVVLRCDQWASVLPAAEEVCCRAAGAALETAVGDCDPVEFSVVLADDPFVRELNQKFRGIDAPTNVLAFPVAGPQPAAGEAPVQLGDIVVAYETVAAEARAQGKTLADHVAHLVVHGTLHLLGYDHRSDVEAGHMERLEIGALAGLGIGDPYAVPAGVEGGG